MIISKLFERFYNKILVNIVVNRTSSDVYIEVLSKSKVIEHVQKNFSTTTLDENILTFIQNYTKESPFSYVSLLNTSNEQGALPSCDKRVISKIIDLNNMQYKCHEKKWAHYSSRADINNAEKIYKIIGLDYIFSPYSILANFFKEKISSPSTMFILIHDNHISLAIYDNNELLFAECLDMQREKEEEEKTQSQDIVEENDSTLNDQEYVNILDDIDEFGDVEDLDSMQENLYKEQEETTLIRSNDNKKDFDEDYQRFLLIHSSLGHYYSDEKYDSQFIESVYIADSIGVGDDLSRYLEEEMFLNVYIRKIDLGYEIAQLVKMELSL